MKNVTFGWGKMNLLASCLAAAGLMLVSQAAAAEGNNTLPANLQGFYVLSAESYTINGKQQISQLPEAGLTLMSPGISFFFNGTLSLPGITSNLTFTAGPAKPTPTTNKGTETGIIVGGGTQYVVAENGGMYAAAVNATGFRITITIKGIVNIKQPANKEATTPTKTSNIVISLLFKKSKAG